MLTLSEQDDKAKAPDATPASPADSSTAPLDSVKPPDPPATPEGPKSLLDAALEAIKPESEKSDHTGAEPKEEKTEPAKAADPATDPKTAEKPGEDEFSDEELKSQPARTAKRIKSLLASRAELRTEAEQGRTRIAELQPKAASFDHIVTFMRDAELAPQEVSEGFELMRLMKHDPVKALQVLKPYYDGLVEATGGVIAPGLQADVDNGTISEARARELQQANSRAALAQAQADRAAARLQTDRTAQSAADAAKANATAWASWVEIQKRSDPEYAATHDFVVQEARTLLAAGIPSAAELPALFDKAKANVTARLAKFRPSKASVEPARSSSQSTVGSAAGKPPSSMMEAALASIARS